jgi:small-conductance mechanosensitive channel
VASNRAPVRPTTPTGATRNSTSEREAFTPPTLIAMTFLDHFSFSFPTAFGTAALMGAAILTTVLLARPDRARVAAPAFVQRRLGLPKGVTRWLVIGVVAVAALLALGIDLEGLWSTVVAGLSLVAIGFVAMWSILSHMLASVLIVIFRPFEVGDHVEIVGDDPVVGEVTDLNPVYTTLRAEDGGTLQVPNNLFFQKAVKRLAPSAFASPQPLAA